MICKDMCGNMLTYCSAFGCTKHDTLKQENKELLFTQGNVGLYGIKVASKVSLQCIIVWLETELKVKRISTLLI